MNKNNNNFLFAVIATLAMAIGYLYIDKTNPAGKSEQVIPENMPSVPSVKIF